jgi:hypothetical protein
MVSGLRSTRRANSTWVRRAVRRHVRRAGSRTLTIRVRISQSSDVWLALRLEYFHSDSSTFSSHHAAARCHRWRLWRPASPAHCTSAGRVHVGGPGDAGQAWTGRWVVRGGSVSPRISAYVRRAEISSTRHSSSPRRAGLGPQARVAAIRDQRRQDLAQLAPVDGSLQCLFTIAVAIGTSRVRPSTRARQSVCPPSTLASSLSTWLLVVVMASVFSWVVMIAVLISPSVSGCASAGGVSVSPANQGVCGAPAATTGATPQSRYPRRCQQARLLRAGSVCGQPNFLSCMYERTLVQVEWESSGQERMSQYSRDALAGCSRRTTPGLRAARATSTGRA